MSGSDGGGFGGGGFSEVSCESLVIDTQLSSPKENIVELLSEGDVLDVRLEKLGAQTIVVVIHHGDVVGGLASPKILRLRECIESGIGYSASVLSKNEGQVRVRVTAI